MADNSYNTIQPVHGLPNVIGVAKTRDGQKQKKQQDARQQAEEADHQLEEHLVKSIEDEIDRETVTDDPDEHIIDYCA
ncbi:MAG: hypothetical protein ACYSUT_05860 [Planctomycetota bacterium]|jgi:hypothetical protein